MNVNEIINPIELSRYQVDLGFDFLETSLIQLAEDYGGLNLLPDFQRGHVWTMAQRQSFMENLYRGIIRPEALIFKINIPHWELDNAESDLPRGGQIIDGLQRLTTVLRFLKNEFAIFGGQIKATDLKGTVYDPRRALYRFKMEVYNFQRKADLLRFYLSLNTGGTPHSDAEIARVQGLLEQVEGQGQGSGQQQQEEASVQVLNNCLMAIDDFNGRDVNRAEALVESAAYIAYEHGISMPDAMKMCPALVDVFNICTQSAVKNSERAAADRSRQSRPRSTP